MSSHHYSHFSQTVKAKGKNKFQFYNTEEGFEKIQPIHYITNLASIIDITNITKITNITIKIILEQMKKGTI
jgi:hypothetical protein